MDGTENELVMVTIKNEIKYIFYLFHLNFCKSNIATSSTMHGETHGGGRIVLSLIVVENWAICMIFLIPVIWPQQALSMDASHSTGKKRAAPHSYSDGNRAREGVMIGMAKQGDGLAGLESDENHGGLIF
jgi:hypothetical protein